VLGMPSDMKFHVLYHNDKFDINALSWVCS
jgi:hypothetical protein